MAAMNWQRTALEPLLDSLRADYPDLTFVEGDVFCWSPKNRQVHYKNSSETVCLWSLLHEVGHAILGHSSYRSDFELLSLETAAWQQAETLALKYSLAIDPDHIQDCLDTYRDWLHRRSTCPACGNRCLQTNSQAYQCFNCACEWKVSASRFCRPYRQLSKPHKKSPAKVRHATFS